MIESKNSNVYIFHISIVKDVLGFGNRLVFWLTGCPFSCTNCIEQRLQNINVGQSFSVPLLFKDISSYLSKIDGITFTGGEPLFQYPALLYFLDLLPQKLDKLLFTGYKLNELNTLQLKCLNYFDLAIMGRFDYKKKGDFLWRGSKNKKIISPSGKYDTEFIKKIYESKSAGINIVQSKGKLYFYGIPPIGFNLQEIESRFYKKDIIFE